MTVHPMVPVPAVAGRAVGPGPAVAGPAPTAARRRHGLRLLGSLGAALVLGLGLGEALGWPFLAGPAEAWLSKRLDRAVHFGAAASAPRAPFRLQLLGDIRLHVAQVQVADASWRGAGHLLDARDLSVRMHWRDLWAMGPDRPARLQQVSAAQLRLVLARDDQGRANWHFGASATATADGARAAAGVAGVQVQAWHLPDAEVTVDDAVRQLALRAWLQGPDGNGGVAWTARARGTLRGQDLQAQATAGPGWTRAALGEAGHYVPITAQVQVGRSQVRFDGAVVDPFGSPRWDGALKVQGPSLAAAGDLLGPTLPTTAPFTLVGRLRQQGARWQLDVASARVGRSDLAGSFTYTAPAAPGPGTGGKPRLDGRLTGRSLWLADLGVAVGGDGSDAAAQPARGARVLPDRTLDLPSMAAMDAEVAVAIDSLRVRADGPPAASPLRARLSLHDGVLTARDLVLNTGGGVLAGTLAVDARPARPRWTAALSLDKVSVRRWWRQGGSLLPSPVDGELRGRLQLQGQGRSVAAVLASATGRLQMTVADGSVSHRAVEAAGLDLAQWLGLGLRGDDRLELQCAALALGVRDGQVVPQVLVADTRDSTLWVTGQASLADERLALQLNVVPKDFSPVALRGPLALQGRFADPQLALPPGVIARRALPAALLALVNPALAVLPLLDGASGDEQAAARAQVDACRQQAVDGGPRAAT